MRRRADIVLPSAEGSLSYPRRSEARKMLETITNERCPCGHLAQRHRKPSDEIDGEVMGACRDCGCRGLIDWSDDDG